MNAYGIEFINREKADDGREPSQNRAEFLAFAALCESHGVAHHVKSVMYDGSSCSFELDVDDENEHNDIGGKIGYAADATLSHFILFGYGYEKHDLEKGE